MLPENNIAAIISFTIQIFVFFFSKSSYAPYSKITNLWNLLDALELRVDILEKISTF